MGGISAISVVWKSFLLSPWFRQSWKVTKIPSTQWFLRKKIRSSLNYFPKKFFCLWKIYYTKSNFIKKDQYKTHLLLSCLPHACTNSQFWIQDVHVHIFLLNEIILWLTQLTYSDREKFVKFQISILVINLLVWAVHLLPKI